MKLFLPANRRGVASKSIGLLTAVALSLSFFGIPVASAGSSGLTVDFKQASNNNKPNPVGVVTWINSILQASNSRYYEGMAVPQRTIFTGVAPTSGSQHNFTFYPQFTKGGIHAYDFLTSWAGANAAAAAAGIPYTPSLSSQTCSANIPAGSLTACTNLVQGTDTGTTIGGKTYYHLFIPVDQDPFISYTGGSVNTKEAAFDSRVGMPDDGSGHSAARGIDIYADAPISNGSVVFTHDVGAGADTGDSNVDYVANFTSSADQYLIEFAGHLAVSGIASTNPEAWTPTTGSSQINGGPYHFHMTTLDGISLGSQDNQISGASILQLPPNLTLTKVADATSVSAGSSIGFTITLTNSVSAGPANGVTMSDPLPSGSGVSWSITSQTAPTGIDCLITGAVGSQVLNCGPAGSEASSFTLAAGASITLHVTSGTTSASCKTYTNTVTVTGTNLTSSPITAHDSTTVNCAAIQIVKTADAASVNAGDNVGFTITVYNSGTGDAYGVKLSDTLPVNSGLSWSIDSQGAGWNSTCSITSGVLNCGGTTGVTVPGSTTEVASTFTVHITSATTSATCGTVSNTGDVTTTNDGSGNSSDSTTVNCPQLGLIAPTNTTCQEYVTGPASAYTLAAIQYAVKSGVISQTNPGVFFYFSTVTVSAGQTVTTSQEVSSGGPTLFTLNQGHTWIYDTSCNVVGHLNPSSDGTTASYTFTTAGTYILQLQYSTSSIVGAPVLGSGHPTVYPTFTYSFDTEVDGTEVIADNASVLLQPK